MKNQFPAAKSNALCLGNDKPEAAPILGEIVPLREFYSYEAKYVDEDGAELVIPAEIDSERIHANSEDCSGGFSVD